MSRSDGVWYYLPDAQTLLDDAFLGMAWATLKRERGMGKATAEVAA